MTQHLPFPLPAIVQAAERSRALPDDTEARLRQLEQAAADDLSRRIESWRDNDRAAQASWARLAAMIGSVGVRPNPYRPAPMPQQDPRLEHFLRFTRRLAVIRSRMKPLRFHLLTPPRPADITTARDIAPDIAKLIVPTMDNVRALETAKGAGQELRALVLMPPDWPEPERWSRDLQAEALDATELAARCAAALERQQEAASLFAFAYREAANWRAFARARSNRLNETRTQVLAGENAGDCLTKLDFDLVLLSGFGSGEAVPPLTNLNEVLVRAEINETLGHSDEARRLLGEAAKVLEPTLGRVVYPTREQFGAAMLEALTLEMQDKPFIAVLERLRELSEMRALALAYCNVAASALEDTEPDRAARYRATTVAIARM